MCWTGGRGGRGDGGGRRSVVPASITGTLYFQVPRLGGLYLLFDGRDCQCVSAV